MPDKPVPTVEQFARELVNILNAYERDALVRSRGEGPIAKMAGISVVAFGLIRGEVRDLAAAHGVKIEGGE